MNVHTGMKFLAAYSDSDEEGSGNEDESRNTADLAPTEKTATSSIFPVKPKTDEDAWSRNPSSTSRSVSSNESESPIGTEPPPPRPNVRDSPAMATPSFTDRFSAKLSGLPRLPSGLALVSYTATIDEDESGDADAVEASEQLAEESVAQEKSPEIAAEGSLDVVEEVSTGESQSLPPVVEDIDAHEYLEQKLEENVSAGGGTASYAEVELPPAATGVCDHRLQQRFDNYLYQKRHRGRNLNTELQKMKNFRNPSIYEKLIEYLNIDECGSNFSKDVFDPHGFNPSSYYDELAKAQKLLMDKLEKEKSTKGPDSSTNVLVSDERKRKSKWDVPTGGLPHAASAGHLAQAPYKSNLASSSLHHHAVVGAAAAAAAEKARLAASSIAAGMKPRPRV